MCLTVRDELVQTDRPLVQKLVNHIMAAGVWLDASPAHRTQGVEVAAGADFFNQDVDILKFVMRHPPDRVTYGDLRMIRQEFEELMQHLPWKRGFSAGRWPMKSLWTRALYAT